MSISRVVRIRFALAAVGLSSALVGTAVGQGTQWAPSRTTVRPERSAGYEQDFAPRWQQTPMQSYEEPLPAQREPIQPSRNALPTRGERPVRTAQITVPITTQNSSGRATTRRLAYDVELQPGEQLVGETRVVEGGSSTGGKSTGELPPLRAKTETVPVPDGISSRNSGSKSSSAPIREGEIIYEGHGPFPGHDGDMHLDPGFSFEHGEPGFEDGHVGGSCCDGCNSCTGGRVRDEWADPSQCPDCGYFGYHRPGCGRVAMCLDNCLGPLVREWSIFAGSQGFKGPLDGGLNGNFGFNEGFNLAGPLIPFPRVGLGYQVGARFAHSDLSGTTPFGLNTASRDQSFVTVGLYHRAYRGCGFQFGVAYDWLTDNYVRKTTYGQVRAETSFLHSSGHEIGFYGAFGTKTNVGQPFQQADQYNFFYRYTTEFGGQGRVWGGFTGNDAGIFGTDFRVPMSNRFDFVGGFNYIIPNNGNQANPPGAVQESWGLSLNIVWYVGRGKRGIHNTPFRPLFNVADNNVMMLEQP